MILATNVELPIGKVVRIYITDTNGISMEERVPCLIIKEATRQDFEDYFSHKWPIERLAKTRAFRARYYYWFSTD